MSIYVEVFPIMADAAGVWLLDEDAWRSATPVPADSDAHAEVILLLAQHGLHEGDGHLMEIHSTSWRQDGPRMWLTWYAAVDCPGPVIEHWPNAQPIDVNLAQHLGRAPEHGPLEQPAPRDWDVLLHALRHIKYRMITDQMAARMYGQGAHWRRALDRLEPAMAEMYGMPRAAA